MQQFPQQESPGVPLTVLRISVLGPLSISYRDAQSGTFLPLDVSKWHGKGVVPALSLLALLISQPHRYASQDWISEQLWRDSDAHAAKKRLSDVVSFLRGLLRPQVSDPETLVRHVGGTRGSGGGYQLAPYPAIWVDADAFLHHMHLAALHTQMEDNPLPYLEVAYELGARGEYLMEEPYSDWAVSRREEVAGAFRSCVHQLGHLYLERGCLSEAELFVRSYWASHMADEDALRLLMHILGRQERWSEVDACYLQTCEVREQVGEAIDPRTHDLAEYWRSKPLRPPVKSSIRSSSISPSQPPSLQAYENVIQFLQTFQALLPKTVSNGDTSSTIYTPLVQPSPITYNMKSQLSSLPSLGILELLMLSRRQTLRNVISIAGSFLVFSPNVWFPQESREHLERAIANSSYLDEEAIDHLAAMTQNFWELCKTTAGIGLLDGIASHLATLTQFLREPRPTHIYKKLVALASETARLLGNIFHEIREYHLAWDSYVFALNMAQESDDFDLWGSVVARLADFVIFWGEPQEALPLLEAAQTRGIHDLRLRVQLASLEAEIYARTKDMDRCLGVLDRSKMTTLTVSLTDDRYRTGFTSSVAKGWEAACWIWLHKPELALPILNDSFATYDPTSMLRRSYLLANSGWVHGQLGDATKACEQLLESLSITAQTKSLVTLQMIYQGRTELDPWKKSEEVKELDTRIVEVYKSLAKVKEWV